MVRQLAGYDPAIDELPPELAAQYRAEQRKQRVADVLSGQALRPLQAPEVKGRFQGAVSPVAGLAQLAQAYLSSKMANDADARFADIGKRGRDAYSAEVKRVGETIMGRPDEVLPPDVAGPPQPGMPAGTPDQVAQALLSSYAPSLRRMGETAFKSNLDAQATMNLMKMFGQDNAPPPAVPAAAMPAAPAAPAGAPAAPRPEAAAWPPSAAVPGAAAQEELRQNPGLTPSRGPWNTYPDTSGQQRILQAEAQDPAAAAETAALALRHPSGRGGRADPAVPAQANLDALPTTPTPLEAYTRRQKYSKREAQAMMVSGNKAAADIGKRIFDGYEKAEQETLIKQPGRETLAAFPVAPVKIEDPNQPGREVMVDARNNDRVIGSVMPKPQGTAAADKTAQQRQKQEEAAAATATQLDAIERNLDKITTPDGKITKGLKNYVGQIDQYFPDVLLGNDTAAAGSALKSLQDQLTMVNLAAAKKAVGQSFGSMQVKEWDKFMNAQGNIGRGVPDKEMESNIAFVRKYVKDNREVLRVALEAGKNPGGEPTTAPAAPANVRVVDW